jgi:ParB-like chromosome segregation protein Spo0J
MNKLNVNAVAFAMGLAFSVGAMAQGMSKQNHKAGQDRISADYTAAKARCASLSGNPNDICEAEAKGKAKVARAELDAAYLPSDKARHEARIAKAEADQAVAKERCDDMAGNAKDVCLKVANAVETAAKADAKAQMKTAEANAVASETSADARAKADNKSAEARKEATDDKLDAQHGVAKQQCDTFAGSAKDACLDQAKARFTKP